MLSNIWNTLLTRIQQTPAYASWLALQQRERQLVKAMLVILLLATAYYVVWEPIVSSNQQAISKLNNSKNTWLWLNQQQQAMQSTQGGVKQVIIDSQSKLTSYIQQQIAQQNIKNNVSNISPISSANRRGIQVEFAQVSYPRFFRWLSKMEQEGVLATDLKVERLGEGIVKASVQFEVAN
ncbi:MAG TPA: hypothetical protein DD716_04260 [Thiomicrospira sp.]|jgi:type II secretory pathway component PulM|nr:hypothetical protein [Thiomicrospira sp.]